MKRFFVYLTLIAAILSAFTGCRKETATEPDIIINDTTPYYDPNYPDPVLLSAGQLVGKIMPETKYALTLYNSNHTYTDFDIMNRTGAFIIKDIKAGDYSLLIEPYDPNIAPMELTRITVDSARTTNLGLIFLP
jgi:hypothetical protein